MSQMYLHSMMDVCTPFTDSHPGGSLIFEGVLNVRFFSQAGIYTDAESY